MLKRLIFLSEIKDERMYCLKNEEFNILKYLLKTIHISITIIVIELGSTAPLGSSTRNTWFNRLTTTKKSTFTFSKPSLIKTGLSPPNLTPATIETLLFTWSKL